MSNVFVTIYSLLKTFSKSSQSHLGTAASPPLNGKEWTCLLCVL